MADITVRKPKAVWQKKNPVLPAGQYGFEEETGKVKKGDGVRRWLVLPYLNTPPNTIPDVPPAGPDFYEELKKYYAHLENGVLVIDGQPVGGTSGGGGTPVDLNALDQRYIQKTGAVELAVSGSSTLTPSPVNSGMAADAGHTHRLPNVDANGYITLTTTDGTPIKIRVVNGIVGAGGGGATTPAAAPEKVTGLTVGTVTEDTIPLSWTAPAPGDGTIGDYIVQVRVMGAPSWLTFTDGTGNTTSTTVTGLAPETTYEQRVVAMSEHGTGEWSDAISATTLAVPGGGGEEPGPITVAAFSDDFTAPNNTWLTDRGWSVPLHNIVVIDNVARYTQPNDGVYGLAVRDFGSPDGTIAANISDLGYQWGAGLVFRYVDTNNYFEVRGAELVVVKNGTRVTLTSIADNLGELSVVLNGSSITVFCDGVQQAQVTSTAHPSATRHGIVINHDSVGAVDNFSYTPPAAGSGGGDTPLVITTFIDDFERPDAPIGNGWHNTNGDSPSLAIRSGKVTWVDGGSTVMYRDFRTKAGVFETRGPMAGFRVLWDPVSDNCVYEDGGLCVRIDGVGTRIANAVGNGDYQQRMKFDISENGWVEIYLGDNYALRVAGQIPADAWAKLGTNVKIGVGNNTALDYFGAELVNVPAESTTIQTFFSDDFNRADQELQNSPGWTMRSTPTNNQNYQVVGNQLRATGAEGGGRYATFDGKQADGVLSATVLHPIDNTTGDNTNIGLIARWVDANNNIQFRAGHPMQVGGTAIDSNVYVNFRHGDKIAMHLEGEQMTAYLNGLPVGRLNGINNLFSTQHGVWGFVEGPGLDDISFSSLPSWAKKKPAPTGPRTIVSDFHTLPEGAWAGQANDGIWIPKVGGWKDIDALQIQGGVVVHPKQQGYNGQARMLFDTGTTDGVVEYVHDGCTMVLKYLDDNNYIYENNSLRVVINGVESGLGSLQSFQTVTGRRWVVDGSTLEIYTADGAFNGSVTIPNELLGATKHGFAIAGDRKLTSFKFTPEGM